MTQGEFAELIGIHENTQGRYERGDRLPDGKYLNAASSHADINPIWLLHGQGPRSFLEASGGEPDYAIWTKRGIGMARDARAQSAKQRVADYEVNGSDEFAFIPHYDARAAAGHGALVDDQPSARRWAFERSWIAKEVGVPPHRLILINVAGTSVPELHDGDVVMVDRGDIERIRDSIYIFVLDGHLYVKRLELQGEELKITSRHGSEVINLRENPSFRLIGRVVGRPRFDRL